MHLIPIFFTSAYGAFIKKKKDCIIRYKENISAIEYKYFQQYSWIKTQYN